MTHRASSRPGVCRQRATGVGRGAGLVWVLWALLALGGGAAAQLAQDQAGPDPQAIPEAPLVLAIHVTGNQRFSAEQIRAAFWQKVGKPLDGPRVSRGLQTLWSTFHVRCEVSVSEVEGGVELLLVVRESSADFEPRMVGNVEIDEKKLYEWAGLTQGAELFPSQARRARQRLMDRYRREGFYWIDVNLVERDTSGGEAPDIIFEIREGPKVWVDEVVIHGNKSLPERGLLLWRSGLQAEAHPELSSSKWPHWPRSILSDEFVQEQLDADIVALRTVYRDRGWLDAIVEVDRLEFSSDRSQVKIHITIDEGEPYTVSSIDIEAFEFVETPDGTSGPITEPADLFFPKEELLALCLLKASEQYSMHRVRRDYRTLALHYGEQGYISHPSLGLMENWRFLEPLRQFDYERKEVQVTYRIAQGRLQRIREIRFSGILHTKDRVVRRELSVFPGQIANLNQIERSLGRLTASGYFSNSMRPQDHPEPVYRFLATEEPGWKDLEFEVEEGNVLGFNLSGGAGSNFGLFGSISLSVRNFDATEFPSSLWSTFEEVYRKEAFHGAGQSLSLLAQPGTQISRYQLRFTEPDLFRTHIDRYSGTFGIEQRYRIFQAYDERRRLLTARIGRQVTPDASIWLGVEVGDVRVDNLDTGGEPSLPEPGSVPDLLLAQQGTNKLNQLQFGWTWRTLNSAYNPSGGHAVDLTATVSEDAWGSDFDFGKVIFSGDWYGTFSEPTGGAQSGYKFSLGAGLGSAWGRDEYIPYTERYYLGGFTMRGFEIRGVGPNQNGHAVGGETMLRGSFEYRHPLISTTPPGSNVSVETVRGLLFTDLGVLGPNSFDIDLGETRGSVGVGIGLTNPLPFTFTYAFPIWTGDGDDLRRFTFNLGL